MSDHQFRKVEQYSPKSSPARGSRSPAVPTSIPRGDSTGTLKTTISLGKNPTIISGPFYLIKEPPTESELTGSTNLMVHYGLEHSYNKSNGRKVKDTLSSFLPNIPGNIDLPGHLDNSSLRSVIERPPITGKELLPLNSLQLSGFRLHPGPLPDSIRYANTPLKKKSKHKKHKQYKAEASSSSTPGHPGHNEMVSISPTGTEKKHKKKRHDDDKERKKRKKEKKKKKQKHSPDHI